MGNTESLALHQRGPHAQPMMMCTDALLGSSHELTPTRPHTEGCPSWSGLPCIIGPLRTWVMCPQIALQSGEARNLDGM